MTNPIRKQNAGKEFEIYECPLLNGDEHASILLDYCSRRLKPELVAELERHMAQCQACAAFASSQSAVWNALDSFEAEPVSEDFDQKLWARIEREGESSVFDRIRGWLSFQPMWKPAVPLALAMVVGVGLWLKPDGMQTVAMEPVAKSEKVDAEQLERALEDIEMLQQLGVVEASAPRQM